MVSKNWLPLFFPVILLASCTPKQSDKPDSKNANAYPPSLYSVLEAHGGIEKWNQYHTLSFALGDQTHTVDLKTRELKIEAPNFSIGNDDGNVWLKQDSTYFEGSPRFYHNLMFYFHTMPFVFADDGINYEEVPDKKIKGMTYEGIKMTFDENVGDAPKDEYILYYDPETYKMEWLAYFATYFSQKKSDSFNLIHYKKWKKTDGFLLPAELQWYEYENGEAGNTSGDARIFTNTHVSKHKMDKAFFDVPEDAVIDSTRAN